MKKLIQLTIAAVFAALVSACAPKTAGNIAIKDAANAAPENAELFFALDISKKLQDDYYAQKGAKEFSTALLENPAMQKIFEEAAKALPEEINANVSAKAITDFAKSAIQNPDDLFIAAAATDLAKEDADFKFVILKHAFFTQKIKEALEQKKFEKTQKDGFEFFKKDDFIIAFKGKTLVLADNEKAAMQVFADLQAKAPREKSFASNAKFAKLMSIEKSPYVVCFADCEKASEGKARGVFFSAARQDLQKTSGAVKIELGKKAFKFKDETSDKIWEVLASAKLAKNTLLKNSLPDATMATAVAFPKIDALESALLEEMGETPEGAMAIAMLKSAGIKNITASAIYDAAALPNIQNMELPESFIKIEAADTDAVFKNEMVAQALNSPLFSQMDFEGKTVYSSMYNAKIVQAGKNCAVISTLKDMAAMMALAKGKGKSLEGNADAKALAGELPEGNFAEFFMDGKNYLNFIKAAMPKDFGNDDDKAIMKFYISMAEMCKKSLLAAGVKLEPNEITITFKGLNEYDYELGTKLLKEIK